MVEQNKYNEAFTKALMASDLPLVVELMEMVDSGKIFSADLPGGTALEDRGHNYSVKKERSRESESFKSEVKMSLPKHAKHNANKSGNKSGHKTGNKTGYDTFTNEFIHEADSFFGSRKKRGKGSRSNPENHSDSGFRSDTEQKLSQFFLLNKY